MALAAALLGVSSGEGWTPARAYDTQPATWPAQWEGTVHLGFGWPGWGGPRPGAWIERLARDLGLDADQKKKIDEILARRRERVLKDLDEGRKEIREVLRPDQQQKFDAMPHDHFGRPGWRQGLPPGPPGQGPPGPPPDDASPGPPPAGESGGPPAPPPPN